MRLFHKYSQRESGFVYIRVKYAIIALFVVLGLWIVFRGPTSCQLQLNTGDLRYCWYGIPIIYQRLPESQRRMIEELALHSQRLVPKWVTCVRYPLIGSNNPDKMYRRWYIVSCMWIKEDPYIARLILEDVASFADEGANGLPQSARLLMFPVVDQDNAGNPVIEANWRNDPIILEYLKTKSYHLGSTRP